MMRRAILVLMLVAGLAGLAVGLLWSFSGPLLRWGLETAAGASGGRLLVDELVLDDARDLRIGTLRWIEPAADPDAPADLDLTLRDVRFEWRVLSLLLGQVDLGRLEVGALELRLPASDGTPVAMPASLALPLRLAVREASLRQLRIERTGDAPLLLSGIGFGARYGFGGWRIDDLGLSADRATATLSARIADAAPFALEGRASVTLAGLPSGIAATRIELEARGDLDELGLDARLIQPGEDARAVATLSSRIRPLAPVLPTVLEVSLSDLDLSGWSSQAPRTALSGTVRIDHLVTGRHEMPDLDARIELVNEAPAGRVGLPAGRLATDLRLRAGRVRFEGLSVETQGLRLRADLLLTSSRLAIERARLDAGSRGVLTIAGGLQLVAPWRVQASGTYAGGPDWPVALGGTWTAEGPLAALDGSARAAGPLRVSLVNAQGELAGMPVRGAVSGSISAPETALRPEVGATRRADDQTGQTGQPGPAAGVSALRIGDRPMPRIGDLRVDLTVGASRLTVSGAIGTVADRLTAVLQAPSIGPVARALGQEGITGALTAEARVDGDPRAPSQVEARVDLRDLSVRGLALRGLQAEVAGAAAAHTVRLHFDGPQAQGRLTVAGVLEDGLRWRGTLDEFSLARPLATRLSRPARLAVDGGALELADLSLDSPLGALQARRAAWRDGVASVDLDASVPRLAALLDAVGLPTGNPTADATLDALSLELSATLSGTTPKDLSGRINARLRGAPSAAGAGRVDLTLRAGELAGDVDLQVPTLAFANRIIGPEWAIDGRLALAARLSGTLLAPRLDGEVTGEGLGFEQRAMGWRLRDGTLSARFDADRLKVRSLKLHSVAAGGGWAELRGEIQANGQGRFDLDAERLVVPIGPGQRIVLSGAANAESTDARLELRGRLRADEGLIELAGGDAPALPDDVVVLRRRPSGTGPGDSKPAMPARTDSPSGASRRTRLAITSDLALDLGENLRVRGSGVDARLGGTLQLRGTLPDAPRAFGTVRIRDGAYQAYGRRLDIVRGSVVFNGPLDNPALDILALRREQPVEAGVALTGTVLSPVVRLASRPEVPDVEKLSWLVLGVPIENVQSGAQGAALQAAAATLFGRNDGTLSGGLARALGVDVLTLRTSTAGSDGLLSSGLGGVGPNAALPAVPGQVGVPRAAAGSGTVGDSVVAVGKRLGSGFTVTYEQGLRGVWNLLRIQYALSRRLTLRAQTGSESALDLLYRVSFD